MADRITVEKPNSAGSYYAIKGHIFDNIASDYARVLLTEEELIELGKAIYKAVDPDVPTTTKVELNEAIVDALSEHYDGGEALKAYMREKGVTFK